MKRITYLVLLAFAIFTSCEGQTKKKNKSGETISTHTEEKGNPKVDIKVNKHYDKNGNLVSYDSTYSSYYSSRKGDKILLDSMFKEFKPGFSQQFPLLNDKHFNELFFNDSLLYNDFFHNDFFSKRFELNEAYMTKIMHQMDSVKNAFFKTQSKTSIKK